ncbi:hypothetical protein [Estrella lausannensis]|uniref:Putative membrane protein n=1 Tax=Estrella lausannensis TaxID=483423 RepID=A0A0H5E3Q2_9BACT|nr:hypothetical protein [Estrella lausannensis]CRX37845.1 putative membrane protein [Estrella lausannensis]
MSVVLKPFEWITGFGSDVKKSTGTLDSFSKVVSNGWKAIEVGAQVSNPAIKNVMKQFGAFSGLVGALNIVDRGYEWFSPKKREDWTWQKYVSQSALTVSHGLEFSSFLHNAGAINLGSFISPIAPGVVPLEVVKNTFYIPASFFGIWHSAISMGKQDAKVASLEGKVQKWTDRMQSAAADKDKFLDEVARAKLQVLGDEIGNIKSRADADGNLDDADTRLVAKLENRQRRWTVYVEQLENGEESATLNGDCQKKIDGYNANVDIEKQNSGKVKTKEWLGIANNVGKLVLGILGLVALFVGFAASTVFVASFAAGWFATHTLNLAKSLYEERNRPQSYRKPHLDPVAV